LCVVFESDSEYERLLMIQTTLSYKINPRKWKHLVWYDSILAEVVDMTEQVGTVGNASVSSVVKRKANVSRRKEVPGHLLLSAIDEELKRVFKEEGASVIYDFIENKCELKREKIVEKPEVFSAGLERLLGSAGPVIEKAILVKLYSRLGLEFPEKFSDHVKMLREKEVLTNE